MGEIFKGNFGQSREEVKKEEIKKTPEELQERTKDLMDKIKEEGSFELARDKVVRILEAEQGGDVRAEGYRVLIASVNQVSTIKKFLRKFHIHYSTETLATAEKHWASLSNEDLVEAIKISDETLWQKYPNRYQALVSEWGNRIRKITEVFQK